MFRRFWAGPRCPASKICFSFRPRSQLRRLLTQRAAIPRRSTWSRQTHSKILSARVYGSIFLSIGLLVTNEALDWEVRRNLAVSIVQEITLEPDMAKKLQRYWELGPWLLQLYSGAEAEDHGPLPLDTDTEFAEDELQTELLTVADPERPGGTFILCQGLLAEKDEDEVYVAVHGNRLTDVTEALLSSFETFAKDYGSARGVVLLMQPNGDWKSVYFDGRRWINVVYLEWQTPTSMGFRDERPPSEAKYY
ncbi:hypothetical protein F4779DRAFT_608685 [Xylariaceae sp. FL0662B]|nr:hypothetical protein F4779DRAFT_608685 [Xylariaceae sp. FL0662B]